MCRTSGKLTPGKLSPELQTRSIVKGGKSCYRETAPKWSTIYKRSSVGKDETDGV